MTTEKIEVPSFKGYKCLGFQSPKKFQYYLTASKTGEWHLSLAYMDMFSPCVVYEKLPPKRYVFEETGEVRPVQYGEYFLYQGRSIVIWLHEESSESNHKIIKLINNE